MQPQVYASIVAVSRCNFGEEGQKHQFDRSRPLFACGLLTRQASNVSKAVSRHLAMNVPCVEGQHVVPHSELERTLTTVIKPLSNIPYIPLPLPTNLPL
jgi:hypothetical protein